MGIDAIIFVSFWTWPKDWNILWKEGAAEESNVDFEIGVNAPAAKSVAGWEESHTEPVIFCCLVTRKE